MAHPAWIIAVGIVAVASHALATNARPSPMAEAPAGTTQTRYCMRNDPLTGSLVQTVQCWTREEWAEQGVDIDREWLKNGVNVEGKRAQTELAARFHSRAKATPRRSGIRASRHGDDESRSPSRKKYFGATVIRERSM